jgi:hypothetical protein
MEFKIFGCCFIAFCASKGLCKALDCVLIAFYIVQNEQKNEKDMIIESRGGLHVFFPP